MNTSVIQDKTLTIYINFGKFKLEKAPNFVTRPASNVDRRKPFGSEKKIRNAHISEMRSNAFVYGVRQIPCVLQSGRKLVLEVTRPVA